jgi:hypothetical protein
MKNVLRGQVRIKLKRLRVTPDEAFDADLRSGGQSRDESLAANFLAILDC